MKLGLYIHIPFCRQKCAYCDFPSFAGCEYLYEDYVAALCREIAGKGGLFSSACADTLYIGGGTPTLLTVRQLTAIVEALRRHWTIAAGAEFSIEANPGTVDEDKLRCLLALGVNRISFGVQSFDDRLLRALGRIHSAREAADAIAAARRAGFRNINVDLMSCLPGQTLADWRETLAKVSHLGIQHISAYGLKIEEGTLFYQLEQQHKLTLPAEEEEEAMYDLTSMYLPQNGFIRYEISNYALAGYECRHNLKYWRYQPYIGLGAGAHSFHNGRRSANTAAVAEYISCIQRAEWPVVTDETVAEGDAMAEYIFLALRTTAGLRFEGFHREFNMDIRQRFAPAIAELSQKGWLIVKEDRMFLTEQGMKFGNAAFVAFLPD